MIRPPSLLMPQVKHIPGRGRAYIPDSYFWGRTSENALMLDFSHLVGTGIDMFLTPLHKKCLWRCPPSADHGDGALSSFHATSLNAPLRRGPSRYLGTL